MEEVRFPFDIDFQRRLLRYMCEDTGFAHLVADYLEPSYFEQEALSWAYATCMNHRATYAAFPTLATLRQYIRQLDPQHQNLYWAVIDQVEQAPFQDITWLRDATLSFIKRNIFVRSFHESKALFNAGKLTEAYDLMMGRMDKLHRTTWEPVDRTFYFRDLPIRQNARMGADPWSDSVSTGQPWLDSVLDGGLSLGELGIWVAYAKVGKSIMLINLGVAACQQRRKTLHVVFEGSLAETTARYDAHYMDEFYHAIKRGDVDAKQYAETWQSFREQDDTLVIRAFTERWDYSVVDIHEEIKALEREHGWRPELIVVDYGDLLSGREKSYNSETEKQKAAFRDLKSLANRGHRIWTASQARRPPDGAEDRAHWVYSRNIADCYEKVRIADFLGTLNATLVEKEHNVIRALAELYRGGAAGKRIALHCEYGKAIIEQREGIISPSMPDLEQAPALGYKRASFNPDSGVPVSPQQQRAF